MSESRRDPRFIAEHRGGALTREEHQLLAQWAMECVLHGIHILKVQAVDELISQALDVTRQWIAGEATVGDARKAAIAAHAAARKTGEPVMKNLARAAGHAAATAHMADHAPGAALYTLKAIAADSGADSMAAEQHWQTDHLPETIRELVSSAIGEKMRLIHISKTGKES